MVVDNEIAQQGEVKEVVVEENELTPETIQAMEELISGLSEYFLFNQGWLIMMMVSSINQLSGMSLGTSGVKLGRSTS